MEKKLNEILFFIIKLSHYNLRGDFFHQAIIHRMIKFEDLLIPKLYSLFFRYFEKKNRVHLAANVFYYCKIWNIASFSRDL